MKAVVTNILVGFVKVLFHVFGFCTCCKKEVMKDEKTQNESQGKSQGV